MSRRERKAFNLNGGPPERTLLEASRDAAYMMLARENEITLWFRHHAGVIPPLPGLPAGNRARMILI